MDPGEKGAILETGGRGPPGRGKGRQLAPDSRGEGTWQHGPNMDTVAGDGLATASRDGYAKSECFCALYRAVIQYNHDRNRVSLYYLFQENKSFGTYYHLHSSSDVREVVSRTILMLSEILSLAS